MLSKRLSRGILGTGLVFAAGMVQAQYGLIDNYEGVHPDTYPNAVNLYGGANGFFDSGGVGGGGGAGELAGSGVAGSTGIDGGAGGDFAAGLFYGYFHLIPGGVDLTQTAAGMSASGVAIDFQDRENDGDRFAIRLESGGFSNSTAWYFTNSSLNTYETHTFLFTDPPDDVQGAGVNLSNVTGVIFAGVGFNGGTVGSATFNFDNLRFTGTRRPNTGDVENFNTYPAGPTAGNQVNPNTYGGQTQVFTYGAGSLLSSPEIVDAGGGNRHLRLAVTGLGASGTVEGGVYSRLLPRAGSIDLTLFESLSIDLAVAPADVGDQFAVRIETADAPDPFMFWSSAPIAPTASLTTYTIPFASLTGGPGASFDPTLAHTVTVVQTSDSGNGQFTLSLDNIVFDLAPTSAATGWNFYR